MNISPIFTPLLDYNFPECVCGRTKPESGCNQGLLGQVKLPLFFVFLDLTPIVTDHGGASTFLHGPGECRYRWPQVQGVFEGKNGGI